MFGTTHDAANREAVREVAPADLNLVGIAMRAERKVIDKIVDGLKFHSRGRCLSFHLSRLRERSARRRRG